MFCKTGSVYGINLEEVSTILDFLSNDPSECTKGQKKLLCLWILNISSPNWNLISSPDMYERNPKTLWNTVERCVEDYSTGIAAVIEKLRNGIKLFYDVYFLCCRSCEKIEINTLFGLKDSIMLIMSNILMYESTMTSENAENYYVSNSSYKTCPDERGMMLRPNTGKCIHLMFDDGFLYAGPLAFNRMQFDVNRLIEQGEHWETEIDNCHLASKDGGCKLQLSLEHYIHVCCCASDAAENCSYMSTTPQLYEMNRLEWYTKRFSHGLNIKNYPFFAGIPGGVKYYSDLQSSTKYSYRSFIAKSPRRKYSRKIYKRTKLYDLEQPEKFCAIGILNFTTNTIVLAEPVSYQSYENRLGLTCINITELHFSGSNDIARPQSAVFHYMIGDGVRNDFELYNVILNHCAITFHCNTSTISVSIFCRCDRGHSCNHQGSRGDGEVIGALFDINKDRSDVARCGSFIWSYLNYGRSFYCWSLYDWNALSQTLFFFPNYTIYIATTETTKLEDQGGSCAIVLYYPIISCNVTYQTIERGIVCAWKPDTTTINHGFISSKWDKKVRNQYSNLNVPLCYRGRNYFKEYRLSETQKTLCYNAIVLNIVNYNYRFQVLSGMQHDLIKEKQIFNLVTKSHSNKIWILRYAALSHVDYTEGNIFGIFSTCLTNSVKACNGPERVKNVLMPQFVKHIGKYFPYTLFCGIGNTKLCKTTQGCYHMRSLDNRFEEETGCLDEIPALVNQRPHLAPILICSGVELLRRKTDSICFGIIGAEIVMCCCKTKCDIDKIGIKKVGYI